MRYSGLLALAVQKIGSSPVRGATADRILNAALSQFEVFGINRSTVEDITKRSGLSRVTLYRHFASKDAIIEAVLLRELDVFLRELQHHAAQHAEREDKLVEGFVFVLNGLRAHPLLQRLLATEPDAVLPILTTDGASTIGIASQFLASQLAAELPDDDRTQLELLEVAEVTVRIIVSLVLTPSQHIALGDDYGARAFARRHLLPALLGLAASRPASTRHLDLAADT